jgi:predicted metal-dependent phosphoesterase TrpH
MFFKGDFHLHTNASDGKLSPKELVHLARERHVDIMAVTDHDTISSVEAAIEEGVICNIKVIPGIELSTTHNGESVHVLGYFKDDSYKSESFQKILTDMTDYRIYRGEKIVENLKYYFGIEIDYKDIIQNAKGVIARPHIAKAIVDAGYPYSYEQVFKKIISEDSPAYVPKKNLSVAEGINLLKSVNALAVLAHPVLLKKVSISDLLYYNFDGIEAIYHSNSIEQTAKLKAIAAEYNKIITGGSDFHGISERDNGHGDLGCVFLSSNDIEIFLENLKK